MRILWVMVAVALVGSVGIAQVQEAPAPAVDRVYMERGGSFSGTIAPGTDGAIRLVMEDGTHEILLSRIGHIQFRSNADPEVRRRVVLGALRSRLPTLACEIASMAGTDLRVVADDAALRKAAAKLKTLQQDDRDARRAATSADQKAQKANTDWDSLPGTIRTLDEQLDEAKSAWKHTPRFVTTSSHCPRCMGFKTIFNDTGRHQPLRIECPMCKGRGTVRETVPNTATIQQLDAKRSRLQQSLNQARALRNSLERADRMGRRMIDQIIVEAEEAKEKADVATAALQAHEATLPAICDAVAAKLEPALVKP